MDLLLSEDTRNAIARISGQHKLFAEKLNANSSVENIRFTGTIIAFDIKTQEDASYFNSVRDALYDFFLANGIILRPLGNTLYVMPPYCITKEELNLVYTLIEERLSVG